MTKRPCAEFDDHLEDGGSSVKKLKTSDAMEQLTDRADDLIECLQSLKRQGKSADAALTQRLTSLSRELLPSFQSLAKANDVAEKPVTPPTPVVPVLTPWSASEVAETLPLLPPILDPALERASFTHAGAVQGSHERSYEKLEWVGDAYLYLMSTVYIYLTFPQLKHGDMAHIREVLVRNSTLGDYSVQYGLDKRIVYPAEYGINGREGGTKATAKERKKVLGDVFEAHVAAIILSDPISGVANAAAWLKSLWSTTISKQIRTGVWQGKQGAPLLAPVAGVSPTGQHQLQIPRGSVRQQQEAPQHRATEKLNAELVLQKPRVVIEYRSLDAEGHHKKDPLTNLKLFTQGAFLVGYDEEVLLGSAKNTNKKVANEQAAQNALGNKRLMNIYRAKKQAIQESKRAAEQAASKGLGF